jgi:hypothetical protein
VKVDITLPTDPSRRVLPLLTSGTSLSSLNVFGLQVVNGHQYRFVVGSSLFRHWATSAPLPLHPGKHVVVDLVMDANMNPLLQSYSATVGGVVVLSGAELLHPASSYTVGRLPMGLRPSEVGTAPAYPAALHQIPVTTPICTSLVR